MDPSLIPLGAAWFVAFVFSTTIHEAGHALAALRMGDPTAYQGGQVSLNPWPHIRREPLGMVVVPLVSFALMGNWMFGWASAPYDPKWAYRYPKRNAVMALAGPAGNLVLILLSGGLIRLGFQLGYLRAGGSFPHVALAGGDSGMDGVATLLSILFSLNLVLLFFNLLPLPPLDGSGVIQLAMSDGVARRYMELMSQPMWALVGLVLALRLFPPVFYPLYHLTVGLLYL